MLVTAHSWSFVAVESLVTRFKALLDEARERAYAMESPRLHDIISRLHGLVDELDEKAPDGYFDEYIAQKDENVRLRAFLTALDGTSGLTAQHHGLIGAALRGDEPASDFWP